MTYVYVYKGYIGFSVLFCYKYVKLRIHKSNIYIYLIYIELVRF